MTDSNEKPLNPLKIASLSLNSLLLLRVALDSETDNTDIEQDIQDLFLFPERLLDSYPDEWRAYIKRRAVELDINLNNMNEDSKLTQLIRAHKSKYENLLAVLKDIETLLDAGNVSSFKTPLHKWLEWAVS
jgi:hypothetical protein